MVYKVCKDLKYFKDLKDFKVFKVIHSSLFVIHSSRLASGFEYHEAYVP